jgi:DNA-binding transcriptional ArsR family regulator
MVTRQPTQSAPDGDADIAQIAELFAHPARARILMALADGRSLPASVLADEAGLSASSTSAHLGRLLDAGVLSVEPSGRHRYFRLAGPHIAETLEALARIAPPKPVKSLREHTRAHALRRARTCYDHLAGMLGVAITAALVEHDALATTDGLGHTGRRDGDPLSSQLPTHPYCLGPDAERVFAALGVDLTACIAEPGRRPLMRFCLDWTEQRHHLAGRLGAALADALLSRGWTKRSPGQRAVLLTPAGSRGLREHLGLSVAATPGA